MVTDLKPECLAEFARRVFVDLQQVLRLQDLLFRVGNLAG